MASLTWLYLKVGNTTFGGGYPTIAIFQRDLVERERWLTEQDYALAFSLARITPGTTLLAFCAATGYKILGLSGAVAAVFAESLPSAVLAVLLTDGYESWGSNAIVMALVGGATAAVAGMMWSSALYLTRPYFIGGAWKKGRILRVMSVLVFSGGAFAASWKFGMSPILILGVAALVGLLWKEPVRL